MHSHDHQLHIHQSIVYIRIHPSVYPLTVWPPVISAFHTPLPHAMYLILTAHVRSHISGSDDETFMYRRRTVLGSRLQSPRGSLRPAGRTNMSISCYKCDPVHVVIDARFIRRVWAYDAVRYGRGTGAHRERTVVGCDNILVWSDMTFSVHAS